MPSNFWSPGRVGVNSTASNLTPGSPRAFISRATAAASSQGAPTCSNGWLLPRPADRLVPSKNTVPG
jgi:hypothetical protein